MKCLDFDWQINEFMVYCHRPSLRKNHVSLSTGTAINSRFNTYISPIPFSIIRGKRNSYS